DLALTYDNFDWDVPMEKMSLPPERKARSQTAADAADVAPAALSAPAAPEPPTAP
ncbi:unnamed protein product, partial [Effrenium voratum]